MGLRYMLISLIFLLLPLGVSAELYRYTDESGVVHFTDNYIEIPEAQRSKVKIIDSSEETATPQMQAVPDRTENAQAPMERAEGDASGAEAVPEIEAVADGAQSQQQFEALIQAKADLDKIYNALADEKEALIKEQKTLKTIESIRAYQNKVNQFNQRLANYERQRMAFQTRAEAYNKILSR